MISIDRKRMESVMMPQQIPSWMFLPASAGSAYLWNKRRTDGNDDEFSYLAGIGAIGFGSWFAQSVLKNQGGYTLSVIVAFLIVGFSAPYAYKFYSRENKIATALFISLFILANVKPVSSTMSRLTSSMGNFAPRSVSVI